MTESSEIWKWCNLYSYYKYGIFILSTKRNMDEYKTVYQKKL